MYVSNACVLYFHAAVYLVGSALVINFYDYRVLPNRGD